MLDPQALTTVARGPAPGARTVVLRPLDIVLAADYKPKSGPLAVVVTAVYGATPRVSDDTGTCPPAAVATTLKEIWPATSRRKCNATETVAVTRA